MYMLYMQDVFGGFPKLKIVLEATSGNLGATNLQQGESRWHKCLQLVSRGASNQMRELCHLLSPSWKKQRPLHSSFGSNMFQVDVSFTIIQ